TNPPIKPPIKPTMMSPITPCPRLVWRGPPTNQQSAHEESGEPPLFTLLRPFCHYAPTFVRSRCNDGCKGQPEGALRESPSDIPRTSRTCLAQYAPGLRQFRPRSAPHSPTGRRLFDAQECPCPSQQGGAARLKDCRHPSDERLPPQDRRNLLSDGCST